MDIKRLEAFCKVYELKSFSKAGQALMLSQPTISAHVLTLEQRLGAQLFDRLGRYILPTQAGDVLYRHARQAFAALDGAKAEIDLLQQRVSGELAIGCSTIPAAYLLPELLATFIKRYPAVRVRMRVGSSGEIRSAVLAGELAMGVVGAKPEDADLECGQMAEDELFVAASPAMPGYKSVGGVPMTIPVQELSRWPWVIREEGSGTRQAFESALQALDQDPRVLPVSVESGGTETVLQCARQGLGLCVASRLAARTLLDSGELVIVDVPGLKLKRQFYAVRHLKRHFFPALRYFWQHVTNPNPGRAGR